MTRNDLASAPTEAATLIDTDRLNRLLDALEALAAQPASDPELRLFKPDEAADLLGKTENWVIENIQHGRIPYTRVGQSPRLTAAHIRQIAAQGEVLPHQYARKTAPGAAGAA